MDLVRRNQQAARVGLSSEPSRWPNFGLVTCHLGLSCRTRVDFYAHMDEAFLKMIMSSKNHSCLFTEAPELVLVQKKMLAVPKFLPRLLKMPYKIQMKLVHFRMAACPNPTVPHRGHHMICGMTHPDVVACQKRRSDTLLVGNDLKRKYETTKNGMYQSSTQLEST